MERRASSPVHPKHKWRDRGGAIGKGKIFPRQLCNPSAPCGQDFSSKMAVAATIRVELSVAPPVARVTLHNPPLNVIDLAMAVELERTLAGLESRSDISVI